MAMTGRDVQGASPPYTLIVLVMLTVILTAAAVLLYLKWDQSGQDLAKLQERQDRLLTSSQAKDKPYKTAEAEALKAPGRPSVVSYLLSQREELRSKITADVSLSNADLQKKIDAALARLGQDQRRSLSGQALVPVLKALAGTINTQKRALEDRASSLADAIRRAQQAQEQLQAVKTQADKHAAEVDSQMQARQAMVGAYLTKWNANLDTLRKSLDELQQSLRTEKGQARNKIDAIQKALNDNRNRLQALIEKVQQWRKEGGIEFADIVSQADGKIVTMVPGQNTVFIDIGQAEHLPLGLQFEVFSAAELITESTPSKGTIQVVRIVGPKLSECQIVRTAHNQSIISGDLIVNTVYDRQNKYVFRVIGEFDIDGSGKPDTGGAKSVEVLIERWGGKVVPELAVQTDFLVVGSEPLVPDKPDDFDLAAMALYEDKLKEVKAYMDAQNRAVALSIPMLNHKRFLYLLGLGNRSPLLPLDHDESDPWPP